MIEANEVPRRISLVLKNPGKLLSEIDFVECEGDQHGEDGQTDIEQLEDYP